MSTDPVQVEIKWSMLNCFARSLAHTRVLVVSTIYHAHAHMVMTMATPRQRLFRHYFSSFVGKTQVNNEGLNSSEAK